MRIHTTRFERGSATLGVMMALLFGMTLIVFFVNRSTLVEIKTSANQFRAAKAMEAAEAGQEWVLAQLNSISRVNATCVPIAPPFGAASTFKKQYLDPDNNPATLAYSGLTPGCIAAGGTWNCSCPTGTAAPSLAGTGSAFTVAFAPVGADPALVRVTSTGCASWPCSETSGMAKVEQILIFVPALQTPPAAPLTAKSNVNFGANAITVTNTDPSTNGITINAGGTINGMVNSSTITTTPGTPPQNSLVGGDTSLSSLSDDQMFRTFFGRSKETFRDAPSTTRISCPSNCTQTLLNTVEAGATTIWVTGDMDINSNAIFGGEASPIVLVVDGNIHLNGGLTIYGVVYSTDTEWNNTGGGNGTVLGAMIAEGSFVATGTPNPTYDPKVLQSLRGNNGHYVKVPGSWKDL